MEELEQERKAARKAGPARDAVKVREHESCRLARIEVQRQFDSATHPARREQIDGSDGRAGPADEAGRELTAVREY